MLGFVKGGVGALEQILNRVVSAHKARHSIHYADQVQLSGEYIVGIARQLRPGS